jgi:hypothetical protein
LGRVQKDGDVLVKDFTEYGYVKDEAQRMGAVNFSPVTKKFLNELSGWYFFCGKGYAKKNNRMEREGGKEREGV